MEKLTDDTFEKWRSWANIIKDDIQDIVNDHQVYTYFVQMVDENIEHIKIHHGIKFYAFVTKCYTISASSCIRRHLKKNDKSISLIKLLEQIHKSSNQFSYDFYKQQFPDEDEKFEWQKMTFESFSVDMRLISENIIKNDIDELLRIAGKISDLTDRVIAHLDKRGKKDIVTFDDLNQSIEIINKIACKYITLITGIGYATLKPSILYDWKRIFSVPFDLRINELE